jgi:hypothetical protein
LNCEGRAKIAIGIRQHRRAADHLRANRTNSHLREAAQAFCRSASNSVQLHASAEIADAAGRSVQSPIGSAKIRIR